MLRGGENGRPLGGERAPQPNDQIEHKQLDADTDHVTEIALSEYQGLAAAGKTEHQHPAADDEIAFHQGDQQLRGNHRVSQHDADGTESGDDDQEEGTKNGVVLHFS